MAHGRDAAETRSDAVLGYLQELVLSAALLGERLPGARRPVRLGGKGKTLRGLPTRILSANLASSLKLDDLPRRLEAISADQLVPSELLAFEDEIGFLAFRPASWKSSSVELSMVIATVRGDQESWQCREVGHIDATFRQIDGRWSTFGEPHVYIATSS